MTRKAEYEYWNDDGDYVCAMRNQLTKQWKVHMKFWTFPSLKTGHSVACLCKWSTVHCPFAASQTRLNNHICCLPRSTKKRQLGLMW